MSLGVQHFREDALRNCRGAILRLRKADESPGAIALDRVIWERGIDEHILDDRQHTLDFVRRREKADRAILPADTNANARAQQLQRVRDVVAALRRRAFREHHARELANTGLGRWIVLIGAANE